MPSRRIPHRLTRSESSGPRPMRFRSGTRRPTAVGSFGHEGGGDVSDEQRGRGKPGGSGDAGNGGSSCDADGQAYGGFERGGDDDAEAALAGDPQGGADAAEGRDFDDDDVGGFLASHLEGVLGAADGFVGGDGHVHAATYLGQLVDGQAGLLDVFDGERRRRRPSSRGWRRARRQLPRLRWRRGGS